MLPSQKSQDKLEALLTVALEVTGLILQDVDGSEKLIVGHCPWHNEAPAESRHVKNSRIKEILQIINSSKLSLVT